MERDEGTALAKAAATRFVTETSGREDASCEPHGRLGQKSEPLRAEENAGEIILNIFSNRRADYGQQVTKMAGGMS